MKRFTKKAIAAIMSVATLTTSAATLGSGALTASAAVGTTFTYQGVKYQVVSESSSNPTAKVIGVEPTAYSITVPKKVTRTGSTKQYKVVSIDPLSFQSKTTLYNVYLKAPITSLPYCCFYGCANLIRLELPETLTSINGYAIAFCPNLNKLEIPYACTNVYSNAFCGTDLNELHVHNISTTFASNSFTAGSYPDKAYAYYYGSAWSFLQNKAGEIHDLNLGDVDNTNFVNLRDKQKIQKEYVEVLSGNPSTMDADQRRRADVNRDGSVSIDDAQLVLMFYNDRPSYECTCRAFEEFLSQRAINELNS